MKNELFYKGSFGIERETLRVDRNDRFAQTPHPFTEGVNKGITRDFCENQIELITPVCSSVREAVSELEKLDRIVRERLDGTGERLWIYSNPPHFDSEEDIPIAAFTGEHSGKTHYRRQLEKRYGRKLMTFSGVHFNFSFDDEYLRTLCGAADYEEWKNGFYLRLYKQLSIHSWLPLLLTAASPIYDRSLDKDGASGCVFGKYASVRNSERGYWNSFVPVLEFESLDKFVSSIKSHVESGRLFSASELYLPIRLKPNGVNSIGNFANGVSHVELRMFDLNPTTPLGVDGRDLEFAHLLIMYLSRQPDFDYTPELQKQAVENHRNASLYDLVGVRIGGVPILDKASEILDDMLLFFCGDDEARDIIGYEKRKLGNRLCERITAGRVCG